MQIGRIPEHTRIVGKAQGYLVMPLRDELINCGVGGPNTPSMVTAWIPLPKELERLNAGDAVYVRILGNVPPPMMVGVGSAPLPGPPREYDQAVAFADHVLNRAHADPDDDVAVLARQFLRTIGRI